MIPIGNIILELGTTTDSTLRHHETSYVMTIFSTSKAKVARRPPPDGYGITTNPNAAWIKQVGRNLTDCYDGFLNAIRYLILDRDTQFIPLRGLLESTATGVVLLPPRSPNLNAFIERYMRSMKDECLDRMIFIGEKSLRRALAEYEPHYHTERNHQGLSNNIIDFQGEVGGTRGPVKRRERLVGMLSYYYRDAA